MFLLIEDFARLATSLENLIECNDRLGKSVRRRRRCGNRHGDAGRGKTLRVVTATAFATSRIRGGWVGLNHWHTRRAEPVHPADPVHAANGQTVWGPAKSDQELMSPRLPHRRLEAGRPTVSWALRPMDAIGPPEADGTGRLDRRAERPRGSSTRCPHDTTFLKTRWLRN